jgi:hypothetical protein
MAHVIDYVEFAVDDLEQAKAFYAPPPLERRSPTTDGRDRATSDLLASQAQDA